MNILSVKNIHFSYGSANGNGHKKFSLQNISFDIPSGGLLGICGPNGSGKSTLLRLLCGALSPRAGEILLNGKPLNQITHKQIACDIALVPQEISSVFSLTVEQMVCLGFYPRTSWFGWRTAVYNDTLKNILILTDLWDMRHRLTSHLSGGERRRVLLARALAQDPKLLLLDEPTAHLDPRHQMEIVQLIEKLRKQKNLSVITVLHDLNLALDWCPEIMFMKEGRVLAKGKTKEFLTSELLERTYDIPGDMMTDSRTNQRFIHFTTL